MTVPDPALLDPEAVASALGVDPKRGHSSAEAARRLAADGANELRAAPPVRPWRRLLRQFRSPLILLLLVAVAVSVAAWVVEREHAVPIDAIVILAIVLFNAVLGFVQEARAEQAVAALATMTAANSSVVRDGALTTVPAAGLVRGDILSLGEGDTVGADARILSAHSLKVAEAALTGESEAVLKSADALPAAASLGDQSSMVFKGTAVVQGRGLAIVTAVGMGTEMGAIARMLDETVAKPTPLQREINAIGRVLGIAVIAVALVVMLATWLVNPITSAADVVVVLLLGVSLAVAAVPEGLPAILSVVLALGVQRMASRNAVVKELSAVESLGAASVICADKTGTLTRNEMTIERLELASGRVDIEGVGYRPEGAVLHAGHQLEGSLLAEAMLILRAGSMANNAQLSLRDDHWHIEGDPTEAAFLVAAEKFAGIREHVERFERHGEIPFTSERRMMSTLHHEKANGSTRIYSKGAPDVLLENCTHVQVGDAMEPLTEERRRGVLRDVQEMSSQAYRTLGLAYRKSPGREPDGDPERDLVFLGLVGIIDPPRTEVARSIAEAHRAGIRVIMITGDHPATAARIAADLGIIAPGGRAVSGAELDALDAEELRSLTREVSVYARVAPQHKLRLVAALQADGHIVAMTGDGVNDAPALKAADIGVAMGITGTEVTKESARMILADDNFETIVAAVRQGRVIFDNIRKFLRYLLSSNIGEVLSVFLGVVFAGALGFAEASPDAIVLPLLATQILWINLVSDSGPAFALGIDPEVDDVMARRPRGIRDRAIGTGDWIGIVSVGLVTAVVTLFAMDLLLPGGLVPGTADFSTARTAGFTTLVFAQLFNTLNARSATTSAFRGMFTNRWMWLAFAATIVLQLAVVHLSPLQLAFGTAPMDPGQWLMCVGLASGVLWFGELRKAAARPWAQR